MDYYKLKFDEENKISVEDYENNKISIGQIIDIANSSTNTAVSSADEIEKLKTKVALHKLDLEIIYKSLEKINNQSFTSPYRGRLIVALMGDIEVNIDNMTAR